MKNTTSTTSMHRSLLSGCPVVPAPGSAVPVAVRQRVDAGSWGGYASTEPAGRHAARNLTDITGPPPRGAPV